MKKTNTVFTVYEGESVKLKDIINNIEFNEYHLENLIKFSADSEKPYFSLIRRGIKFHNYVGSIQASDTIVEIIPHLADTKEQSKQIFLDLLSNVVGIQPDSSSEVTFKLKYSILDIYVDIFLRELEILIHRGLIKKYRKKDENSNSIRGKLLLTKTVQKNSYHKDKFYITHNTYDYNNIYNIVIYQTLLLLRRTIINPDYQSRIGSLFLLLPELSQKKIRKEDFEKITYNQKTYCYKYILEISKLILFNLKSSQIQGNVSNLSFLFELNEVWNKFITLALKKHFNHFNIQVFPNIEKNIMKFSNGSSKFINPDILIIRENEPLVFIDTSWKTKMTQKDIVELFAHAEYLEIFKTVKIILGKEEELSKGKFLDRNGNKNGKILIVVQLSYQKNLQDYKDRIVNLLEECLKT